MKRIGLRTISIAVVCTATTLAGVLWSGTANAVFDQSASVTMTSDPGDFIGLGIPHEFSTAAGDSFNTTLSADGRSLDTFIDAGDVEF